jgi:2-methylcitrate dehydratase PrpD
MGTTAALAEWVAGVESLPPDAERTVRRSLVDWIGCAAIGATHPAARIVRDFARAEAAAPRARVIGSDLATASHTAAWVNAVQGHVHDFDDSGAHPSSYLTPTVLALGDELDADGRSLVTAWAAGFEVSARLAAGLHPDRRWHTTPLFGTLGATAAAAKLLGLTASQLRNAFGIAASSTGGLMANFGTMTKALHPADAARNAIIAARLAERGFTANQDIVEDRYGYADCFGSDTTSFPAMTAQPGEAVRVDSRPPAIKAWPTCSSNHPTLTVIETLLPFLDGQQIQAVDHYSTAVPGTGSLRFREVQEPLQAKFCLEYNIAAAFVDGEVSLASFTADRFARGDLQRFMTRVHRHHDPTGDRIVVTLTDGTRFERTVTGRRTLSTADTVTKFRTNIAASGLGVNATAVLAIIENGRPVRRLIDQLAR